MPFSDPTHPRQTYVTTPDAPSTGFANGNYMTNYYSGDPPTGGTFYTWVMTNDGHAHCFTANPVTA